MLHRKLLRDLRRQRWQMLAVVIVTALGTALFVSSYLAYQDLRDSYRAVQIRTHLADMTLDVTTVTAAQTRQVARLPGVAGADRQLVLDLPVVFPTGNGSGAQPGGVQATGRLIGIPLDRQPRLDQVLVAAGHYPTRRDEVLIERHFANYYHTRPGDRLQIAAPAGRVTVRVAGIGVSAEYLWVARNRQDIMPSPAEFGVLFVPRPLLTRIGRAALSAPSGSLPGGPVLAQMRLAATSDVGNRLLYDPQPDANGAAVLAQVRAVLGAGTILAATPRAALIGVQLLQLDVDGLQEIALAFPFLFLAVGAFIVAALLHRQVDQETPIIGTMIALGLRQRAVVRHYLMVGLVIGVLGAVVGGIAGIVLGNALATAYADQLSIPDVRTRVDGMVVFVGVLLGLAAPLLAGIAPARRAARLEPAVAMRPSLPAHGLGTGWSRAWIGRAPLWLRLPLRDIGRHPWRALATAAGVSAALVLVISTAGMSDATSRGLDLTFNHAQRYDLRADFYKAHPATAVQREARALAGVRAVETLISLPVRLQSPRGDQSYDTVLQGLPTPSPLLAVLDAGGTVLQPRADAAVLSRSVAHILHVGVGDRVRVRVWPGGQAVMVRIGALSDELLGNALTLSAQAASRDFGLRGEVNTVLLTTDPGHRQIAAAGLRRLAGVTRVTDLTVTRDQWASLMGLLNLFLAIMLLSGVVLAAAILFNTASVSILERRRELATMRALGRRMGGLVAMVTVENGLLALAGLAMGFPIALACLWAFVRLYSSDLFSLPFWLYPRTVILALVGVLLVVLIAQGPALRGVARMNVAEAAKARE